MSQAKKVLSSQKEKRKKTECYGTGADRENQCNDVRQKNNNNNSHGLGLIIERNVMRLIRTKDTIAN